MVALFFFPFNPFAYVCVCLYMPDNRLVFIYQTTISDINGKQQQTNTHKHTDKRGIILIEKKRAVFENVNKQKLIKSHLLAGCRHCHRRRRRSYDRLLLLLSLQSIHRHTEQGSVTICSDASTRRDNDYQPSHQCSLTSE